jgi:Tol biopolymer transport system component
VTLPSGARLGPYEILSPLGAGGMGEVYKARDTRLDRTVAIKILSEALAADPLFRERFDREARAISQLTHPHICTLYDVGEAVVSPQSSVASPDSVRFIVMECLQGETLADRLKKGALPLDEGLVVAMQIAGALSTAHRHGIVHRDLKPGNVMLTKTGAKLLDFGLAKASGPAIGGAGLSMLPTTPPNLTAQGAILGTFQYMAPEQLEGHEADARTDVFAFGAVLHEMLTGKKAFAGASHASLISSIMSSSPPPVSTVQTVAPAELDHLIARCLAKDPENRWQSARDVALQLSWIAGMRTSPAAPAVTRLRSRERFAWALAALALVTLLAAVAVIVAGRRAPAPASEPIQFVMLPPVNASFSNDVSAQAVSPDGRQIAFVASAANATTQLWIRRLDSLDARALAGTEGAAMPFWSPDSRSVGFFAGGKLKRVDVISGPPQTLADASFPLGGSWNRDGVIVFGAAFGSPLFQVPAGGGAVTPVTTLDATTRGVVHNSPSFLPDGRHFFFVVGTGPAASTLYVGSLDSKDARLVLRSDSAGVYSPSGHVLFLRESTLMAQPFDLASLSTRGEAIVVAEGVGKFFSAITFTVSDTGILVYRTAGAARTRLLWVNRAGQAQVEGAAAGVYQEMSLSPDGTRAAFARPGQADTDVWLTDLDRRITSRFTFRPPMNNVPIWSPDGRQIVFASARDGNLGLYQRASDASGPEAVLLRLNAQPFLIPSDWSADGRFLAFYRTDPKTQLDIWTLPMGSQGDVAAGTRTPVPFLHADYNESEGQFSPDGRWIAYVSDESGTSQVYVQSYPTPAGPRQVSPTGGTQPRWRRDGKELFYLAPDRKLMALTVRTGATFDADAPRALFQTALNLSELRQAYSVSSDGQRFLLNTPVDTASPPMTVVLSWPALLKK